MMLLDLSFTTAAFTPIGALLLMAVQGGLVWLLARKVARMFGWNNPFAKIALMFASWVVWVLGGAAFWTAIGGSGGLMDGGVWFFIFIPSGIWGSVVACFAWVLHGAISEQRSD